MNLRRLLAPWCWMRGHYIYGHFDVGGLAAGRIWITLTNETCLRCGKPICVRTTIEPKGDMALVTRCEVKPPIVSGIDVSRPFVVEHFPEEPK